MAARPPPPPAQKVPAAGQTQNAGTPNQSLYVKNLNEKINRDDLKRALYMLFSTYGTVLDVVTARVGSKKQTMRGQAHVVFRDVQTSTQAMRALQGFELFEKKMNIAYAKGTSNIIPKLRGTFEASTAQVASESTELQKSIFNAPPSNIPAKPITNGTTSAPDNGPHGTKRPREEEEEEEEDEGDDDDVEMEEDDDAPMDEDDDD